MRGESEPGQLQVTSPLLEPQPKAATSWLLYTTQRGRGSEVRRSIASRHSVVRRSIPINAGAPKITALYHSTQPRFGKSPLFTKAPEVHVPHPEA